MAAVWLGLRIPFLSNINARNAVCFWPFPRSDFTRYDRKQEERRKQRTTRVGLVLKNITRDTLERYLEKISFSSFSFSPFFPIYTRKISFDGETKMGFWNCWRWQWSTGRLLENLITRSDEESSDGEEIYSSLLRSFAVLSASRTSSELPVLRFISDFVNSGESVSKKLSQRNSLTSVFHFRYSFHRGTSYRSTILSPLVHNGIIGKRECQIAAAEVSNVTYEKEVQFFIINLQDRAHQQCDYLDES